MTMDPISGYRLGMFDGKPDIAWLQPGWRGLRFYGRRAKAAIEAGDMALKGEMIARAEQLLTLMRRILDTDAGSSLGPALMTIYSALSHTLLRANTENDIEALLDYDKALAILDRDMIKISESVIAA
jgi:flagellar biosynthetic protein FliS